MRDVVRAMEGVGRAGRWLEALAWTLLLVSAALISYDRASRGRYDFQHFYLDADYVWKHAALNPALRGDDPHAVRQLPFYLPTVPLALAPMAAGGQPAAAAIWTLLQVGTLAYALARLRAWIVRRDELQGAGVGAFWLMVLVSLPAIYEATKFNQVTWITLALLLAGQTAIERARPAVGGAFLAAAAVLKLLPALLLIWLVLERRWKAAAAMCVFAAIFVVVPPLVAFGPHRALQYHREWWEFNVQAGADDRWLTTEGWGANAEHFIDRRNQSIAAICGRLFWPEHAHRVDWQPLSLTKEQTLTLAKGISAALGLLLLLATWARRGGTDQHWASRGRFSLYLIAIQVLAPLARMYYLAWTLPALAVLAAHTPPSTPPRRRTAAGVGVIAWMLGMVLWAWRDARELGAHQLVLIVMAFCVWKSAVATPREPAETAPTSAAPPPSPQSASAPPR
jgi:alpha-1,2-mannosyltransferase